MLNYFNEKSFLSTDPKGRLLLPKEVRSDLKIKKGDLLYLIPNLTDLPYLEIRTKRQWVDYIRSLREQEASQDKKDSIRYAKMFKETATVDGQGRILLPQNVRDFCNLNGAVTVVDMEIYVEVWCKENIMKRYADLVRAFKNANDRTF